MLGCSLVIERHVRKLGRAGLETLTGGLRAQGGLRGKQSVTSARLVLLDASPYPR